MVLTIKGTCFWGSATAFVLAFIAAGGCVSRLPQGEYQKIAQCITSENRGHIVTVDDQNGASPDECIAIIADENMKVSLDHPIHAMRKRYGCSPISVDGARVVKTGTGYVIVSGLAVSHKYYEVLTGESGDNGLTPFYPLECLYKEEDISADESAAKPLVIQAWIPFELSCVERTFKHRTYYGDAYREFSQICAQGYRYFMNKSGK